MASEIPPPENTSPDQPSPRWNWTTKLVFGLGLVALAIWLLVQFQTFLGPIIMALVLAYLFYPIANFIRKVLKIPWRLSVTLIYLIFVLVFLGLITWGGLSLVNQIQNLITFIQNNIDQIPDLINNFTQQSYTIGPWEFSLSGLDWERISSEIVSTVSPIVGQVGSLAGSLATGAANIIFWIGLVLLISYFLLAETEGIPDSLLNIRIPGYTTDLRRIGEELSKIWNAFIRGQLIVVLITVIIYTTYLGIMGIQFFFGLAIIAALGRFVPYVGAWVTWITYGLVALLQGTTIFNLPVGIYAIIILGGAMLIDTMLDNLLVPKVMSENLKVHPALVLVGALIAFRLLGIVGILLAAPVMATIKLILEYLVKKLGDQDPWEGKDGSEKKEKARWVKFLEKLWNRFVRWIRKFGSKAGRWIKKQFQVVRSKFTKKQKKTKMNNQNKQE